MKIKILKLIALFAVACISLSCDNSGEFTKPVEISFTEYSLNETECWWRNIEPDKVTVINNNEELEKYIICLDDVECPVVDFSKHTLLFACGSGTFPPTELVSGTSILEKVGSKKYILSVKIYSYTWRVSILAPKLSNNATVELRVQQIHS